MAEQDDQSRDLQELREYFASLGREPRQPRLSGQARGQAPAQVPAQAPGEPAGAAAPQRVPGPGPRRRTGLTAAGIVAALLVGIVLGSTLRSQEAGGKPAGTAAPNRAAVNGAPGSPDCRDAVAKADRSLAIAVKVEHALAEHTEYMNQLLHGQINGSVALRKGMPSLVMGAAESGRFDAALADYRQVVQRCRLTSR
jgi:hypothetical protein